MRRIVAVMTDFGLSDPYAGQVNAVLSAYSDLQIISITHHVPPHNIALGAHILDASLDLFPDGSVFLAVVDPGLGTDRRGLIIRRSGRWLVGPDNGLLTTLDAEVEAWEIDQPQTWRPTIQATFHARDIFASVAGQLASYARPEWLGTSITNPIQIKRISAHVEEGIAHGQVVHIDTFGNLITSIPASVALSSSSIKTELDGLTIEGLSETYGTGSKFVALIGSWNLLEVARPGGSAATELGIGVGAPITATLINP